MPVILIVVVASIVVVGVMGFAIYSIRRERQGEVDDRLERFTSDYGAQLAEDSIVEEDHFQARDVAAQAIDSVVADTSFARKWSVQLAKADLKLTPGEFLALHFISVGVFFVVGFFIVFRGNIVLSLLGGAVGFFAPRIYLSMRMNGRIQAFEDQLADNLQMWVNGLRAGYSVVQAIEAISKEAPEPTASEFERVIRENSLGIPLEDALDHLLERMPSEDLDLVITAVNIQRQVGGNLAEILETISGVIRERIKLKGEIRVLTSQGRVTGYIIGALPILLLAFLMMVNPKYAGGLFRDKLCGWPMLGCGGSMIAMGFTAINKIIDIEI